MCTIREQSGQNQFKALNSISAEKNIEFLKSLLKVAVVILMVTSISLFLYSVFHREVQPVWFRCPEYDNLDRTRNVVQVSPDYTPTNISHIAFGIGGSIRTWKDRKSYSELWWKPNVTRGYVWLDKKLDTRALRNGNSIPYRISSDWTRFKHSTGSDSAIRIARVISDLFRVGLPNVRWFVMGDDDTVFFTDNLVTVLAKYDHRRMYYIGGSSESVEQNVMHAHDMAFGGGGFAISYPLAVELVRAMDGCLNRYHYFYGSDQRVWACVGEIGIALTKEPGFHQIDIRGDPYGFLAAHPMAPIVSLHHLDYVKPLFPNQTRLESLGTLMEAYQLDPSRTLQQCLCYHRKQKWSVSVSWGYTVQIYTTLLTAKELEMPLRTFQTWRSRSDGPFEFKTRAMSDDPCNQPVVFYLSSANDDGKGNTVTIYKKFTVNSVKKKCGRSQNAAEAIEKVIVSASKMDPKEWHKGNRRKCCDINRSLNHGILRINVRRCKQQETLTI
ncbi:uncharacterized protein LOC111396867 [Olea europaea var. sylvestris]|uniref:Uncharacterized protein LOC111396867 n=1 Tax=Olea europaea subsp. europaea TaxID=158383 RepID=A0A8S0RC93_OLEEU|nr:uncharacterized protein LOC111396867 [Olea europaea var. sylvestris]CAA2976136.1 uncharacterized protein LOC111396867 [Olea europaea subsp. europaea]